MQNNKNIIELPLEDILPNRFQPRIKFDENSINELAISIKKYGVIQPIVVRKIGDKYEIIAGERRYKASGIAGKKTIPAIICELNDKDSVEIALIENVQREDLTPIEKAISYKKILDMGYINQESLAEKVGKSQSAIANTLRLLNLTDEVQEALLENKISERHARSLLKVKDENKQRKLLDKIIKERLTVRKTDEEIEKMFSENNNQPNYVKDEIVNIPDFDLPTSNNDLPGFMNIDKIQSEATDINKEEKPLADMDILLESSNTPVPSDTIVIPKDEEIRSNKFFNFMDDTPEAELENKSINSTFNLEDLFENTSNNSNKSNIEVPSMDVPVTPSYEVPNIDIPVTPSYEVPNIDIPVTPSYEVPNIDIPVTPSYEVPNIDVPVTPSYEIPNIDLPVTPSYEVPSMDVPVTPSYEVPNIDVPVTSSYEVPSMDVPATPSYEVPNIDVPVTPSYEVPNIDVPVTPSYEVPSMDVPVTPSYEVPNIDVPVTPSYEMPNINIPEDIYNPSIYDTMSSTNVEQVGKNINDALEIIRNCNTNLLQNGYIVSLEEADFGNYYQVVFKISK